MINLLPPHQKQELEFDRTFVIVNLLGMTSAFVLLSFVLALWTVGAYFEGFARIKTIEAQGSAARLEMMGAKDLEAKMSEYSKLCKNLNLFYSQQSRIADRVALLAGALPPSIKLSGMNMTDKTISISGVSPDRDTLVKMQSNLEAIPEFKRVNMPPSDWVAQENISFNTVIDYDSAK